MVFTANIYRDQLSNTLATEYVTTTQKFLFLLTLTLTELLHENKIYTLSGYTPHWHMPAVTG